MSFSFQYVGQVLEVLDRVAQELPRIKAIDESYRRSDAVVEGHQAQVNAAFMALVRFQATHPRAECVAIKAHGHCDDAGIGTVNITIATVLPIKQEPQPEQESAPGA